MASDQQRSPLVLVFEFKNEIKDTTGSKRIVSVLKRMPVHDDPMPLVISRETFLPLCDNDDERMASTRLPKMEPSRTDSGGLFAVTDVKPRSVVLKPTGFKYGGILTKKNGHSFDFECSIKKRGALKAVPLAIGDTLVFDRYRSELTLEDNWNRFQETEKHIVVHLELSSSAGVVDNYEFVNKADVRRKVLHSLTRGPKGTRTNAFVDEVKKHAVEDPEGTPESKCVEKKPDLLRAVERETLQLKAQQQAESLPIEDICHLIRRGPGRTNEALDRDPDTFDALNQQFNEIYARNQQKRAAEKAAEEERRIQSYGQGGFDSGTEEEDEEDVDPEKVEDLYEQPNAEEVDTQADMVEEDEVDPDIVRDDMSMTAEEAEDAENDDEQPGESDADQDGVEGDGSEGDEMEDGSEDVETEDDSEAKNDPDRFFAQDSMQ